MSAAGSAFITGSIIRKHSGRADLYLYLDGSDVRKVLTYTSGLAWEQADVYWAGPLSKGNHTFELKSNDANVWGCDGSWGSINAMQFVGQPSAATSVTDYRSGCPASAAANAVLMSKVVLNAAAGSAFISASIIRNITGRAELQLYVDGHRKSEALSYTSSSQWESVDVTWAGAMSAGTHTIEIKSPNANAWRVCSLTLYSLPRFHR